MRRFVELGLFAAVCMVAAACGNGGAETATMSGGQGEHDRSPESAAASLDDPPGVPAFYEEYRMAVDPLFQQAPELIGASYAFSWLDTTSESLVITTTEPIPDDIRSSLVALVPAELPIDYRIVENSAAELEATHQVLSENLDALGPSVGFGTDPVANRVVVNTTDVDDTTATLQQHGVDLVTVDVQQTGTPASEARPGGVDGPLLYSGSSNGDGLDAGVGGAVLFESSCIYLTHAPYFPEIRSLVMWPLGTTWQEDPPAVILPGGDQLESGDMIAGGGGYLAFDTVEREAGPEGLRVVDACRQGTDENVAFFNRESAVELISE